MLLSATDRACSQQPIIASTALSGRPTSAYNRRQCDAVPYISSVGKEGMSDMTVETCNVSSTLISKSTIIQGEVLGEILIRHFHPNSHEGYGFIQGSSTLHLGVANGDENDNAGVKVTVNAGDVIVLPAGTAHSSINGSSTDDYSYIGVYPTVRTFSVTPPE